MKYGFCRVSRPGLDAPGSRVFLSTQAYRECGQPACVPRLSTGAAGMNDRSPFNPLQAQEVAKAFAAAGVDYLFIGKGAAILLGFPGTTQDVDVFPAKDADNGRRLVAAVRQLGFTIDDTVENDIIAGRDFIQLTDGPFDLDIVFAPDGIENYAEAKRRAVTEGIFPVASIQDIIASKRASNRMKDRMDLHLLDLFRIEYELRR